MEVSSLSRIPCISLIIKSHIYFYNTRGEGTKGYSLQFRHLELTNAYIARQNTKSSSPLLASNDFKFTDATPTVDEQDDLYGAMQYIHVGASEKEINMECLEEATERSSLVREVYTVVATSDSFKGLASAVIDSPLKSSLLSDLLEDTDASGGKSNNPSWCLRLRQYGTDNGNDRYGVSKRSSMKLERKAIMEMKPLLEQFKGRVDLKSPECHLYIFQGLQNIRFDQDGMKCHDEGHPYMLVRKVASGASTSNIAPKTRICVTRTPLCPLASFIMCNLAQIKEGYNILDPYAGSCSTLLAASMVEPTIQSVGIEIADNNSVDRDDILKDFESRGLVPPRELIHGDSLDADVRDIARAAIGNVPFDAIIADPPYGRREKYSAKKDIPPLIKFIECIKADFEAGKPLLKRGGRLVAFIPTNEGESVYNGIPNMDDLESAGLEIESLTEQPLSETLSRWLLVLRCTK